MLAMSELILTAAELHRVLSEAALFASDGASLPPINGVQLTATGKHLIAVGTDRFLLGASSAPYEGAKFQVFIRLDSVAVILKLLKPGRRPVLHRVSLRVTPKATRLNVEVSAHEEITLLTVPTKDGDLFPKWKQLIPAKDESTDGTSRVIGFNPEYLGKFGRLNQQYRSARYLFAGPNKPSSVMIGDNFVGIIMPVRVPDGHAWKLPGWAK